MLYQYAAMLESISPKLTDDELYPLIAVGATIYQRWLQHAEGETEASETMMRITGKQD